MGYISRAVRYMSRTNKYEEVPGAEGDDGPGARSRGRKLPKHFTVRMRKGACEAFGATLGNAPTGAVVFTIQEGGVLDRWNEDNPEKAVRPGFVIEKVNGASGYWPVMEALKKSEALAIKIATVPPSSFQEDFVNISKNIEQSENHDF